MALDQLFVLALNAHDVSETSSESRQMEVFG